MPPNHPESPDDDHRTESGARTEALRRLLLTESIGSQDELRQSLIDQGYDVAQSTVSRDLRRLGAVRAVNAQGESVYRLPDEVPVPSLGGSTRDLVISMSSNGALIVIRTTPGSASLIARHLDHMNPNKAILGTIAGDDTIFVAIASKQNPDRVIEAIQSALFAV